ncbi:DUF4391 domain-containing protein [Arthrobacter sp. DNA4]|uniref:DUF4391 domain-containing protein n=1 Tax=Arthrobacter sp. DNA4 TaxID=2963432 RepID=UPI0020CFD9DC|nr:DUF4391 domain-containing protein [Arthrobacter sp. DNA4]UTT71021.1 DUF4391 domain-containing protein [Arthrobacter sp. DNA4]
MTASLYRWPQAAAFGRVVPKTKFYEHTTISTQVREKFTSQVQRITWAYKLAEATVRLRGDTGVPEMQVFVIDAKDDDVSDEVLIAVDKAVQFPVIFEINRGLDFNARTRMTAAYKKPGAGVMKVSAYFTSEWLPADSPRVPLPPAVDLAGLYGSLLTPMMPIAVRLGETLSAVTDRMDQVRKLDREIVKLEKRLRSEPQLNRKVELRRQLRMQTALLSALTDTATPETEDITWRS